MMLKLGRLAALVGAMLAVGSSGALAQTHPSASHAGSDTKALAVPDTQVWLGTVRLPAAVMADGHPLPAGTYRVRLTGEHAASDVAGQSGQLERWVEFVQGNQVKGRALAPVVPASDARDVAHESLPPRGGSRVQHLKGGDYYRAWFNYKGDQVMVYLPARGAT